MQENIKSIIKEKRLEKGLTITALAELLSVSRSYISRIEGGSSIPSEMLLYKIAVVLDIELTILFDEEIIRFFDLKKIYWVIDGHVFSKEEKAFLLNYIEEFLLKKS